jgi:hypothetical protein
MTDAYRESWRPSAAYLYVLHLGRPALAWEYLRRHPDYRHDWLHRRRRSVTAHAWGLRLLEDPALDARDAHPAWCAEPAGLVQFHPDLAPAAEAMPFDLWHIAGHKHLFHGERHLALTVEMPGCWQRFALAPTLEHGMPYVHAVHDGDSEPSFDADNRAWCCSQPRPRRTALLELHTLQALDATLADASMRETAAGLFGAEAVIADWYADGGLRSRVRRLVRRGQSLMRGGYRRLAQLD